jgi:hypothetical protein
MIQQSFNSSPKTRFYPTPDRMTVAKPRTETLSKEETKKTDNDDLDSVSKVSAMTPKTDMDARSRASNVSSVSKATTQSTKIKMQALQTELEEERKRRIEAEKEV